MEHFEGRMLLSGNVLAVASAGVLTLTGDALANQVAIVNASAGSHSFTVTPHAATLINGKAVARTFTGISRISINMGAGNDVVAFLAAAVPGSVSINMGLGQDQLRIQGTTIGGGLGVVGGTGGDRVTVSDVRVAGPTNIVNSGTGNVTAVGGTFFSRLTFAGGNATDRIILVNAIVTQPIIVTSPTVIVRGTAATTSGGPATVIQAGVSTTGTTFPVPTTNTFVTVTFPATNGIVNFNAGVVTPPTQTFGTPKIFGVPVVIVTV